MSRVGNAVDNNIRDFGLQKGFLEALNTWGVKVAVQNLTPEINKIFEGSPVILIGNHPTFSEPFVLPALLPQREDAFMVMSQSFLSLAPHLKQHTLPIFMGYRTKGEGVMTSVLRKILTYGDIDYENAHRRNIESIDLAASRVSSGGLGIVFPAPLRQLSNGQWKTGLGYLINGIKYPSETYLIEAYIEGTARHDVLRANPILRDRYPEIKVIFRDPQKIADIKGRMPKTNERELTVGMEKDYLEWVKSLKRG